MYGLLVYINIHTCICKYLYASPSVLNYKHQSPFYTHFVFLPFFFFLLKKNKHIVVRFMELVSFRVQRKEPKNCNIYFQDEWLGNLCIYTHMYIYKYMYTLVYALCMCRHLYEYICKLLVVLHGDVVVSLLLRVKTENNK